MYPKTNKPIVLVFRVQKKLSIYDFAKCQCYKIKIVSVMSVWENVNFWRIFVLFFSPLIVIRSRHSSTLFIHICLYASVNLFMSMFTRPGFGYARFNEHDFSFYCCPGGVVVVVQEKCMLPGRNVVRQEEEEKVAVTRQQLVVESRNLSQTL